MKRQIRGHDLLVDLGDTEMQRTGHDEEQPQQRAREREDHFYIYPSHNVRLVHCTNTFRTVTSSNADYLCSVISTKASPRRRSSFAEAKLLDKTSFRCAFEVLPIVSHRICGGEPSCSSKRTKSLSLVSTTAPASRAAGKISRSLASRKPRSRTGSASTSNSDEIHCAR